eukprot:GILI01028846.1.p1 GENE.GILI01028846.1~~GILI01028846.1.p1  ORF type:complete len:666 (-),score=165.07 GILI01028846.1:346-2343(-)
MSVVSNQRRQTFSKKGLASPRPLSDASDTPKSQDQLLSESSGELKPTDPSLFSKSSADSQEDIQRGDSRKLSFIQKSSNLLAHKFMDFAVYGAQPMTLDRLINCFCLISDLMFIFLMKTSATMFECYPQPDGTLSLMSYPTVRCYSSEWYNLLPWGIISFLLYGVGIFALVTYVIVKAPSQFNNPRWRLRFLPFIAKYSKDRWWWLIAIFARKFVLGFLVLTVTHEGYTQSLISVLFTIMMLSLHIYFWPSKSHNVNKLELIFYLCQCGVLILTLVFSSATTASSTTTTSSSASSTTSGHMTQSTIQTLSSVVLVFVLGALIYSFYITGKEILEVYRKHQRTKKDPLMLTKEEEKKLLECERVLLEVLDCDQSQLLLRAWFNKASDADKRHMFRLHDSLSGDLLEGECFWPRLKEHLLTKAELEHLHQDAAKTLAEKEQNKSKFLGKFKRSLTKKKLFGTEIASSSPVITSSSKFGSHTTTPSVTPTSQSAHFMTLPIAKSDTSEVTIESTTKQSQLRPMKSLTEMFNIVDHRKIQPQESFSKLNSLTSTIDSSSAPTTKPVTEHLSLPIVSSSVVVYSPALSPAFSPSGDDDSPPISSHSSLSHIEVPSEHSVRKRESSEGKVGAEVVTPSRLPVLVKPVSTKLHNVHVGDDDDVIDDIHYHSA